MNTHYQQDVYYRFSPFTKHWIATGGVMAYCERNKCFWVLDTIASYVPTLAKRKGVDYFLIVTVEVKPDKSAVFTIQQEEYDQEGNHHYKTLIQQDIEYTDLTEGLKFWAINETSGAYDPMAQTVVLLPEEY